MKPQKFSICDILTREPMAKKKTDLQTETAVHGMKDERQCIQDLSGERQCTPTISTPPPSPEPSQGLKHKSYIKDTPTRTKRKRDPIGQILDTLCSNHDKKSARTPSAFSPIITSSCASQLSPLTMLAQCDRRCYQVSPHGMACTSSPGSVQNGFTSQVQASVEQLQFLQAQRLAHQQHVQQQQQQQHVQQHQQQQRMTAIATGTHPFVIQQHNQYHLQMLREHQAKLMSAELTNASLIAKSQCVTQSALAQNPAAPFWMAWLKSSGGSMTSLPMKESRIPPPPRYQCDACKKSYSTFGGLSKHKQFHCISHVKKEFNCKYCDKSYGSLGALKMHIRTHTLPCKCKLCGKAFSRPWLLQGHVRTHTGEKPFKCVHCGRAFADRSNLRAHLQTHSDIKKYGCKNCTKTFSRMSLLLKHEEGSCLGLRR